MVTFSCFSTYRGNSAKSTIFGRWKTYILLSYLVLSGTLCDIGGKEWQNRKIGPKAPNMTTNMYVFHQKPTLRVSHRCRKICQKAPNMTTNMYVFHLPEMMDFAEFPRNVEKARKCYNLCFKMLIRMDPRATFSQF